MESSAAKGLEPLPIFYEMCDQRLLLWTINSACNAGHAMHIMDSCLNACELLPKCVHATHVLVPHFRKALLVLFCISC